MLSELCAGGGRILGAHMKLAVFNVVDEMQTRGVGLTLSNHQCEMADPNHPYDQNSAMFDSMGVWVVGNLAIETTRIASAAEPTAATCHFGLVVDHCSVHQGRYEHANATLTLAAGQPGLPRSFQLDVFPGKWRHHAKARPGVADMPTVSVLQSAAMPPWPVRGSNGSQ